MEFNIQEIIINTTTNWFEDFQALIVGISSIFAMFVIDWQNQKRWQLDSLQKVKVNQTITLIEEVAFVITFLTNILYQQEENGFCKFHIDHIGKIRNISNNRHNLLMLDGSKNLENFYKNIDTLDELLRYLCEKILKVQNATDCLKMQDKMIEVNLSEFIENINKQNTSIDENMQTSIKSQTVSYIEELGKIRTEMINILKNLQKNLK